MARTRALPGPLELPPEPFGPPGPIGPPFGPSPSGSISVPVQPITPRASEEIASNLKIFAGFYDVAPYRAAYLMTPRSLDEMNSTR